MRDNDINHPSFGFINIYKSSGTQYLFGETSDNFKTNNVTVEFKSSTLSNGFGDTSFFSDKIYNEINLSELQWANLLLTKNNENGVPCTFYRKEGLGFLDVNAKMRTLKHQNKMPKKEVHNDFDKVKDKFKSELLEKISIANKKLPNLINKVKTDSLTLEERKEIKADVEEIINEYIQNEQEIIDLIKEQINYTNKAARNELGDKIKSNLFNFSLSKDGSDAKKALKNLSKDLSIDLLENKSNEDIDLETQEWEGVVVLKEVEGQHFVAEENIHNGFSFSLHNAKKKNVNGVMVITPGEKVFETVLSINQFAKLLSSFNNEGVISTVRETINQKNIKAYSESEVSNDELKIEDYYNYLIKSKTRLREIQEEVTKDLKTSKLNKNQQLRLRQAMDAIKANIYGNHLFHFNEIVEVKNKTVSNKLSDVLTSFQRGVQDLGVKQFVKDLKNKDVSLLEKVFKKHNKQLENKNNNDLDIN